MVGLAAGRPSTARTVRIGLRSGNEKARFGSSHLIAWTWTEAPMASRAERSRSPSSGGAPASCHSGRLGPSLATLHFTQASLLSSQLVVDAGQPS